MTHLIPLLRQPLKSDTVIELLEHWDALVIYEFDRLHEGQPDRYVVSSPENGIELLFDEEQRLQVVLLAAVDHGTFTAVDRSCCDVEFFDSVSEVSAHAAKSGAATSAGRATSFDGAKTEWIRL